MIAYRNARNDWVAKAEPKDLSPSQRESLLVLLIWAMDDCQLMGDEYCLSNFDMAVDLYDYYTGKIIRLPYSEVDRLQQGETVVFNARNLEFSRGDMVRLFGEEDPYRIVYIGPVYAMCKKEDGQTCIVTINLLEPYID